MASFAPASLRYRRAAVRDLAWLVLDGALELPAGSGTLAAVALDEAERGELLDLLAAWDREPADDWLGPIEPHLRLGRYTERLIGAWLRHSQLIRLVAMNWPLRENRVTRGEADFLVERLGRACGGLQLWEVACKVYLGVPGGGWLGPAQNDSLAAKLSRIRSHQLRLIDHAGFRDAWGTGWTARAWVAGWLLGPAQSLPLQPPACAGARIACAWAEAGDPSAAIAEGHARALGVTEWWVLPRRRWLRPVFADEPVGQRLAELPELPQAVCLPGQVNQRGPQPLMLAGIRWIDAGAQPFAVEAMRLMLVPAGWLEAAGGSSPARDRPVRA